MCKRAFEHIGHLATASSGMKLRVFHARSQVNQADLVLAARLPFNRGQFLDVHLPAMASYRYRTTNPFFLTRLGDACGVQDAPYGGNVAGGVLHAHGLRDAERTLFWVRLPIRQHGFAVRRCHHTPPVLMGRATAILHIVAL